MRASGLSITDIPPDGPPIGEVCRTARLNVADRSEAVAVLSNHDVRFTPERGHSRTVAPCLLRATFGLGAAPTSAVDRLSPRHLRGLGSVVHIEVPANE